MCEILIRNFDRGTSEKTDPSICYWKRGMPIISKPDSWPWSKSERSSAFKILRLVGVPDTHPMISEMFQPVYRNGQQIFRTRYTLDIDNWTSIDDKYIESGMHNIIQKIQYMRQRATDNEGLI